LSRVRADAALPVGQHRRRDPRPARAAAQRRQRFGRGGGDDQRRQRARPGGASAACITVDATLLGQIFANPGAYYVNIHTGDFPNGAARGQLQRNR
jgi:CHRD domain